MTLDDYIATGQAPADDAEAAAAFNALPQHWQPIPANRVKQWLAEEGTQLRMEAWCEAAHATLKPLDAEWMSDVANQQTLFLVNGVKTLLSASYGDELDITPGNGNDDLLAAAVASPLVPLTQPDADRLVARARPLGWADVSAVEVADARTRVAVAAFESERSAAATSRRSELDAAYNAKANAAMSDWIDANQWDGTGERPALTELPSTVEAAAQ